MQNLNESLQAKYPHLELAILPLSQVNKDNESKRIDSEYFKKEYLENEERLLNLNCEVLGQITEKICNGSTPENGEFEKQGIPFFRSQDFNLLDTDPKQYVTKDFHNTLLRSKVKHKDILIAIIGATLGKIGVIKENILEANINQNIAKVSIKDEKFNPYFVATFLDTYYGQYQIFRLATQTAQEYLNNIQVSKIKIPLFPKPFQLEIEKLVKQSHEALEDSKRLYKEAQELLYKELELDFKNPLKSLLKSSLQAKKASELAIINDISKKYPHLNISVRPLSKSLHKSGRLDSEYYQSKYDLMETKIKDYKGGYCKLQNLVLNYSGGFAFSSDDYLENGDLALIRINNIKNANLDMSNAVYLKKQCEKLSPKDKVKQGDILISMSGSIGLSCLIKENIEAMTNQRILKISIKDFSGDVLVLLLNSIFCKLQFERIGTGGVQTNISSNDILDILIPKINPATQEQIALKIQKSFTLRAKSKDLLQNAKIKIENAIENFCDI